MNQETKEALRKLVFYYWADFFMNVVGNLSNKSPLVRTYAELNLKRFMEKKWYALEDDERAFFKSLSAEILVKFRENGCEKEIDADDFAENVYSMIYDFCFDIQNLEGEEKQELLRKAFQGYDSLTEEDREIFDHAVKDLFD